MMKWLNVVTIFLFLLTEPFVESKFVGAGYRVLSSEVCKNSKGISATLALISSSSTYGPDIENLQFLARYEGDTRLHVKITSQSSDRWEVPESLLPRDGVTLESVCSLEHADDSITSPISELALSFTEFPFGFSVSRTSSGEVLFNSTPDSVGGSQNCSLDSNNNFGPLVFKDQYLEMSTALPGDSSLFGLGESTSQGLRLTPGLNYTLWASDIGSRTPGVDLYGSHPFYMDVHKSGASHGVLLLNSNGIEVEYLQHSLTYRILGGLLDFYFFAGPSPLAVMQQYTNLIGRPAAMPYWSFGFQQSKYGWPDLSTVEETVANFSASNIPLEVVWGDIDYMNGWMDFTLDPVYYPEDKMNVFIDRLHSNGQRYVVIIDPGIKVDGAYSAYQKAMSLDLFIKDVRGKPYLGQVWPGPVHFPDFLHPSAAKYWEEQLHDFYALITYDGLWIDMNEASNFCAGVTCEIPDVLATGGWQLAKNGNQNLTLSPPQNQFFDRDIDVEAFSRDLENRVLAHEKVAPLEKLVEPGEKSSLQERAWKEAGTSHHLDCGPLICCIVCSGSNATTWDNPPFRINAAGSHQDLGHKTIAMSAVHYGGVLEYDAHNLYGLSETIATHKALLKLGKRPFLLTRSSFPGSGAYSAHWTGDNAATWQDLEYSIPGILNSGIFGMPMVGADICGFSGVATEELCARWMQLGAFYPFARNHASIESPPHEPYRWDSVASISRKVLAMRYRLLPTLYTLAYEAHRLGHPIARPVFFTFACDPKAVEVHKQFLLGASILVSPVLSSGATSVNAYFPVGLWYNIFDFSMVVSPPGGKTVELDAPLDTIPVHVYQGSITVQQEPAMTTAASRETPFSILVAFGGASGSSRKDLRAVGNDRSVQSGAEAAAKESDGEGIDAATQHGGGTKGKESGVNTCLRETSGGVQSRARVCESADDEKSSRGVSGDVGSESGQESEGMLEVAELRVSGGGEAAARASGELFVDSPEAVDMGLGDGVSTYISLSADLYADGSWQLVSSVQFKEYLKQAGHYLSRISVLGESAEAGSLSINGRKAKSNVIVSREARHVLIIEGLDIPMGDDFKIKWDV